MLTEQMLTKLSQILFTGEDEHLYIIIDGASVPNLLPKLDEYQPECYCLFAGELTPDMAEVAPYLVQLREDSPFTEWVLLEGWGKHWGVFTMSKSPAAALRNHLRKLVRIRTEKGDLLYFRFYDPRVLGTYLRSCTNQELKLFFGEIDMFITETDNTKVASSFYFKAEKFIINNIILED